METGHACAGKSYFDRIFNTAAIKILPGEYHATAADTLLVTTLGSCVSVCIRDRINGIGGMNHFMLPEGEQPPREGQAGLARYGSHAMKMLIEQVLRLGGRRPYLEAKIFGAGKVIRDMTDVGRRNADFALAFLERQGIRVAAIDVGDSYPRKIYYTPATGKVFVRRLRTTEAELSPATPAAAAR
ncbi:putative chemoreceptor glutamine deamidase CheD 1 [Geotalea uraniireducens]|uniref:Probable chemoreceptor glutamine deamidase CheD n=1 Tax=Geotalea uraniireducens TaxID=351604 RepID=A0ABN6VWQ5_9BACT|nr:chemoreceptor glutamine deamidase CheD [Geotalea uraniireducens]BDV43641.1 putative chemoreceptor glutamine deamidase CheD 1 [Geotalea uraniireducens]